MGDLRCCSSFFNHRGNGVSSRSYTETCAPTLCAYVKNLRATQWYKHLPQFTILYGCGNAEECYKADGLPDVEGGDQGEPVRSASVARHPATAGTAADQGYAAGSPKKYLLF